MRSFDIEQLENILRAGRQHGASWDEVEALVLATAARMRRSLGGRPSEAEVMALLQHWRREFPAS